MLCHYQTSRNEKRKRTPKYKTYSQAHSFSLGPSLIYIVSTSSSRWIFSEVTTDIKLLIVEVFSFKRI